MITSKLTLFLYLHFTGSSPLVSPEYHYNTRAFNHQCGHCHSLWEFFSEDTDPLKTKTQAIELEMLKMQENHRFEFLLCYFNAWSLQEVIYPFWACFSVEEPGLKLVTGS